MFEPGFPIFVTEYGGVSSNGNGTFNTAEMQNWWNDMDANYISSANWAVETNTETSSVFTTTANANGPWQDSEITKLRHSGFPVHRKQVQRDDVAVRLRPRRSRASRSLLADADGSTCRSDSASGGSCSSHSGGARIRGGRLYVHAALRIVNASA